MKSLNKIDFDEVKESEKKSEKDNKKEEEKTKPAARTLPPLSLNTFFVIFMVFL